MKRKSNRIAYQKYFLTAVSNGDRKKVLFALRHGVNPNAKYDDTEALWFAVDMGNYEMARLLLLRGADPHWNGEATLASAIDQGNFDIANLLIQHEASFANICPELKKILIEKSRKKERYKILALLQIN